MHAAAAETFAHPASLYHSACLTAPEAEDLTTTYKQCVSFFRSLYSYAHLLPAYPLTRWIQQQHQHQPPPRGKEGLTIGYRLLTMPSLSQHEAGVGLEGFGHFDFHPIDVPGAR